MLYCIQVFLHVLSHCLFMAPLCDMWSRAGRVIGDSAGVGGAVSLPAPPVFSACFAVTQAEQSKSLTTLPIRWSGPALAYSIV